MSRTLYSASMSLDGFIAGPGDDMQWLLPFFGPDPVGDGLVDQIGALLIGRRTFDGDDPNRGTDQEGAFEGTYHGPSFVLTHRPPDEAPSDPSLVFVTDVESGVAAAKEAAGDRYVSILGADVARQCLEAGLLDEVLVFVTPIMLGGGTRLFDRPDGPPVTLVPRLVSQGPTSTALWYDVRR
jgi:dihydrofolate reductase